MRNLIKNTWLAGLMLFGYLTGKKNTTKTLEVSTKDLQAITDNSTKKTTTNKANNE